MIDDSLWGRHRPTLIRQAYRLSRDPVLAQDLAQDTLVRAWRHQRHLQNPDALLAWMRMILQRLYINHYVQSRRRCEHDSVSLDGLAAMEIEPSARHTTQPELQTIQRIETQAIYDAVARLPGLYRECVILSDIEGLSYQEIAAHIHVPVTTVKTRLHRGRVLVRKELLTLSDPQAPVQGKRCGPCHSGQSE